jgi:hypothetical protein
LKVQIIDSGGIEVAIAPGKNPPVFSSPIILDQINKVIEFQIFLKTFPGQKKNENFAQDFDCRDIPRGSNLPF